MLRHLLYKVLGATSVLLGGSILAWGLYNHFIERQEEFDWEWWRGLGVAGVMVSVGAYWWRTGGSEGDDARRRAVR